MSDNCLNCGGLILEPNTLYGYSGKVCYCPKDPRHIYQRPASREQDWMVKEATFDLKVLGLTVEQIKKLRDFYEVETGKNPEEL